jgi:hypothetical protein
LASQITQSIWDDFNGVGPTSDTWWHGRLHDVSDSLRWEGFSPPHKADDLFLVMKLSSIDVCEGWYGHDGPIVHLGFFAAFEREHNVGVLTDGERILGLGVAGEANLFGVWQEGQAKGL